MVQEKVYFNNISYLELYQPLYLMESNYLCQFDRSHHEEEFCEIIVNLKYWFRRKCSFNIYLYLEL